MLKPRCSLHLSAFSIRTLTHVGQEMVLGRTFEPYKIDVCYVSEKCTRGPTYVVTRRIPNAAWLSLFTFRVFSDPASSTNGQVVVGVTPSVRAVNAVFDWIPVNSRQYTVRWDASVRVNSAWLKRRCLFVVRVYIHCVQLLWDQSRVPSTVSSINQKFTFDKHFWSLLVILTPKLGN